MGDASPHPTSTTNLAVLDRDGNMVVVTQTLLSLFGARLLLPETGILMNNGINWFDPRPGVPNSIGPGKRVLANYAPLLAVGADDVIGLGGAGGRKILPAVLNLASFMIDYGMSLDEAMHAPRIDVSGPDLVVADRAFSPEILETLAARHPTVLADRTVYPYNFTIASSVRRRGGRNEGAAEPWQPCTEAVAE
jgi:gamma-glutamyltranspeptidase/glutathione hydrolase